MKLLLIFLLCTSMTALIQSNALLDLIVRTTSCYFIQKVQIAPRITQQLPPEASNAINGFIRGTLFGTTNTVYTGTKSLLLLQNDESQIARNNHYCNALSKHNISNLDQIEKLIINCKNSENS